MSVRGQVAIGMMTSRPPDVITGALAAFHDEHPGIGVRLIEAPSVELLASLREVAIDLAVISWEAWP
jgi:DNA-binding transcriptional LysR family regulator